MTTVSLIHHYGPISVKTLDEFKEALDHYVHGNTAMGNGTAVAICLDGQFQEIGEDGDLNWELIEEAQTMIRLDNWPVNTWATLRQAGPRKIYCDILHL